MKKQSQETDKAQIKGGRGEKRGKGGVGVDDKVMLL